jgi:Xaa-Pro aminopeptidase
MNCNSYSSKEDNLFVRRIKVLQKDLEGKLWDAWLIENPLDLYYLTGETFSVGELWISKEDVLLLVDSRYLDSAQQRVSIPCSLKSWDASAEFLRKGSIKNAKTTVARMDELQKRLDFIKWNAVLQITQALRSIKGEEEKALIRQSADLLWKGYLYIKTVLREGITEKEVAKLFEIFCLQKGADGLAFEPIIAFGENSALPHYRAGEKALRKGDVVLIDIGVVFKRYCSDMTRVVFFGDPDPLLERWLDLAIEAAQASMALCRPGVSIRSLDKAARSVFQKEEVEPYFLHSLGHGVGLEVHETPRIRYDAEDFSLSPGMVITIEPGLYLLGKGGVRYEDMVVITETGFENLFPLDKARI